MAKRGRPRKGEAFRKDYVDERSLDDYAQVSETSKQAGAIRRRIEDIAEGLRIDREVLGEVWESDDDAA